jgi:hypothetical protein
MAETFQQYEEKRRKDIRDAIFNSNENLIAFTIRDNHIFRHQ